MSFLRGTAAAAFLSTAVACASAGSLPQAGPKNGSPAHASPRAGEVGEQHSCEHEAASADGRASIPAPKVALSDEERARFAPPPNAVPVLLFHQICGLSCPPSDIYGTTQVEFQRMMLMLASAGYTTISTADYVRFLAGEQKNLPPRPILVTFDDGRLDAFRGADEVLRTTGSRATMFVITGRAEADDPFYMSWSEIAGAQASGRWDIQLHGHEGHSRIKTRVDAKGTLVERPFLANRRYDPTAYPIGDHLEPHAAWKARAEADVTRGVELLVAKVPGYRALTMAVPFGDYGQKDSNDPTIAPDLRALLDARFVAWFTQPSATPDFNVVGLSSRERPRYTVRNTTTAEDVYAWLASREARRARLSSP
jgi:peptidoglycan/xylan/chitin deacetylase (PgdA/CDA1 family)